MNLNLTKAEKILLHDFFLPLPLFLLLLLQLQSIRDYNQFLLFQTNVKIKDTQLVLRNLNSKVISSPFRFKYIELKLFSLESRNSLISDKQKLIIKKINTMEEEEKDRM